MADFHPVGFRMMARMCAATDTREILPTLRVPTLLIWGDADARSPLAVARRMHEAIPDARLAVLPGVGHVSNMEAAARFNALVRDFCRTLP